MSENELLYTRSHEWIHVADGIGTIGISKFAVDQLTDLVYVELPPVGKSLADGETFGVVESVKAVSDLYAPAGGEVIEANENVVNDPGLLSKDPYEAGWLIKIRLASDADLSKLMNKQAYDAHTASEGH